VAQTLTFGESGFTLTTDPSKPGTNNLNVVQNGDTLRGANADGSTISHLEVIGNTSNNSLVLNSSADAVTSRLQAQFAGGDDFLRINGNVQNSEIRLGNGDDDFTVAGQLRGNTQLFAGGGNDKVVIQGGAFDSSISMNEGDDTLVFGGVVRNSNINLGTGADIVNFRGSAFDTTLALGGDTDQDTVRLSKDGNYESLRITGADDSDILFIGSTQYSYMADDNEWVNINDPNDVRTFNG
jgi:hypothetical protein